MVVTHSRGGWEQGEAAGLRLGLETPHQQAQNRLPAGHRAESPALASPPMPILMN